MKKTILVFATTTSLIAAAGMPAWSGVVRAVAGDTEQAAMFTASDAIDAPVLLVSDDDDDHRGGKRRHGDDDDDHRRGHDDDDDDCDDDDDGRGCGSMNNAAPAGTVAPPSNGLFNKSN